MALNFYRKILLKKANKSLRAYPRRLKANQILTGLYRNQLKNAFNKVLTVGSQFE